jgi:hypothetical protein
VLAVSFQRFQQLANGFIRDVPASLGALPVGRSSSGELLLPVADGESFWIGLSSENRNSIQVGAEVDVIGIGPTDALSGRRWREDDARSVEVAPRSVIVGIRRPDGSSWAFSRSATQPAPGSRSVRIVLFGDDNETVSSVGVALVDYAMFGRLTATLPPVPLDPEAGYKGWRLP